MLIKKKHHCKVVSSSFQRLNKRVKMLRKATQVINKEHNLNQVALSVYSAHSASQQREPYRCISGLQLLSRPFRVYTKGHFTNALPSTLQKRYVT